MASGAKMSYNHFQSGKFGGLPQSSQKDTEISQDMHLKMSKKIAQLTKVIYALNTKNDENESVLQALRDQHEGEIQQILSDTRQKVILYKERLDEQSDHRSTIEALQKRIAEHHLQQSAIEEQFSQYKTNIREKFEKDQEDYAAKIFGMSHEVLKAKKDFEEHIEKFNNWRDRISAENITAMAEVESRHQKEMEDLRSFQRNQDDTWLNQCAKIEEKFKDQIEGLKSQIDTKEAEKISLNEEFTVKLDKAKAFYEKELDALKNNQTQEHDVEIHNLRKEIDILKAGFSATEKELRIQIDRLVRQLADTEDSLEASRNEQHILQAKLAGTNSNSSELSKQLQELKDQLTSKNSKLHSSETELAASKQHVSDLADELEKKSTLVGELEAKAMQSDSKMAALQAELDSLRAQKTRLEAERSSLMTQQQSTSSEQHAQMQSLRQALEDMTVDKETQSQRYEKQIKNLQEEIVRTEKALKDEMAAKLSEMEKSNANVRNNDRKAAAEVLLTVKQEMKDLHNKEMKQSKSEYEDLQQELESVRSDLMARLASAEDELARLQSEVKKSEEGLGSASGQLKNLKETVEQLRNELEKTRAELKFSKTTAASLQSQLDKAKLLHDSKLAEMELEQRKKIEKVSQEMDIKWKETMKSESAKLRQELTSQMENEKRAALSELSKLKDEEIAAVRVGLDSQIEHLKRQIVELQSLLDASKAAGEEQKAAWALQMEREQSKLSHEMLEAAGDYAKKVEAMERMHKQEMERMEERKNQEKQDLEKELQLRHLEELQGQIAAHRAAIDNVSQLGRREKEKELEALRATQAQEMEQLRCDLSQQRQSDLENLKNSHQAEIMAARMELDRAVEISRQKDKDHQIQLEELRTEIGHRDQHIKNLQDQLLRLQEDISRLKKDIEAKQGEVRQVQKQATQQLRLQEDKLGRQHQIKMDNLSSDHLREQQEMLAQFQSAQEMLKDKISGLQIELQEAQLRYEQRNSRPEDLEAIESLRCEVLERETRIKDLIEEKRFYQLELVNRETNFNKVFNTTPNVGVLNPFAKKKGKGEKGPVLSMGKGGNSSHPRLDPLPNSPLHDGKLNPSKPLPQPNFTKKFVK